jgi:hypothetical protein
MYSLSLLSFFFSSFLSLFFSLPRSFKQLKELTKRDSSVSKLIRWEIEVRFSTGEGTSRLVHHVNAGTYSLSSGVNAAATVK